MTRNTMGIIKGVGGGLAAGMAVGFIGGYKNSGDFPISFSCGKWPLFFCVEKGYKVFSEW